MPPIVQALVVAAFPALVIVAALRDAISYTIPNWISLALIGLFAVAVPVLGLSPGDIGLHLAVAAAALVLGFTMFVFHWIGGGDAKLFAAGALWLGWPAAGSYAVLTSLAGGALVLAIVGLRSPYLRAFLVSSPAWLNRLAEPGEDIPYGLAIAAGALMAFPASSLVKPFLAL
ncbi:MAG TPA: prepilin peptidase [Phenylobacterium sp.]|uniref:A24 family peptidase n=1 Tax=Phenylobacterium sp. TaxID=1871053 RepID=UPI002BC7B3C5|nr:prepilin peptidase [Phenylobacterium sp.]HSV01839.1 prepilin peptidase [Phenylobacterium sp.]